MVTTVNRAAERLLGVENLAVSVWLRGSGGDGITGPSRCSCSAAHAVAQRGGSRRDAWRGQGQYV